MPFAPPASAEEELVRSASQGDRAAFEELYNRNARLVRAVLLARVAIAHVEDLMQDVFIQAYRQLPRLRTPAAFRGWLMSIARNRAAEHHRERLRNLALAPTKQPVTGHEEAVIILDAIRKLPEAYRETLILRLVEGMTGPEIADRANLTPDSVRVNLSRGMKLLREKLTLGGRK